MHVGICRLTFIASHCHSLKEKRAVIRRLKDRVRSRFKVPVSEVAGQNTWQRVVLGLAVVGSDHQQVESVVSEISSFLTTVGERDAGAELVALEQEILVYGDEPFGNGRSLSGATPRTQLDGEGQGGSDGEEASDVWIPDEWRTELDQG